MHPRAHAWPSWIMVFLVLSLTLAGTPLLGTHATPAHASEDLLVLAGEVGRPGGRLVVSLRAEPKTLNPMTAADGPSREVIGVVQADLVHMHRASPLTDPPPPKSSKTSPYCPQYT